MITIPAYLATVMGGTSLPLMANLAVHSLRLLPDFFVLASIADSRLNV